MYRSSMSDRKPMRFCMPWMFACQSIVPSVACVGAGVDEDEEWEEDEVEAEAEGCVDRIIDMRIVCGISKIIRGK